MQNFMSIDAETNGLLGKAGVIAARLYSGSDCTVIAEFLGRCPFEGEDVSFYPDRWVPVREVLAEKLAHIPIQYGSYEELLQAFAQFYMTHKSNVTIVWHIGYPVEVKLFLDMQSFGMIGLWDGPYPAIDIAGNLQQAGEDPTSVGAYSKKYRLPPILETGGPHNPLFDVQEAAQVYFHLKQRIAK